MKKRIIKYKPAKMRHNEKIKQMAKEMRGNKEAIENLRQAVEDLENKQIK